MADGKDGPGPATKGELFISHATANSDIARIIAKILDEAGYTTFMQDKFGHVSFMAQMDEGFAKVDGGGRLVALLSRAYLTSDHCMKEAHYPLIDDASNRRERLIVLRIEDCAPTGFLRDIRYMDLVPLLHDAEAFARAVRGSIDRKAPEADFATLYARAPVQILHPDIRPVPGFTGRADLLDAIDRALWQHGGAAALTNAQSAAVHGLGGVGKSVLAQEYAWLNRARYRDVWWLRAETEQTLLDDLIALGSRLIPGLAEIPERDRAARLALDAIEQTGAETPWLLVYDNAEKPGALGTLTPRSGSHLLITSRWPGWKGHAEALPVDVFPPDVAIDYLLEGAVHPDRDAAGRLAEALGYLPLALAHARAYCTASNLPFDRYRARIAERIKDRPDGADYPDSVFATFSLAMDKAAATCPRAETLMGIAAFLAPDRMPLDIITADVIGEDVLNRAIAALYNVSLITHETLDDGSRAINVHRLVQEAMRTRSGNMATTILVLIALRLVLAALARLDVREHTEWRRVQRVLPHGIAILEYAPDASHLAELVAAVCNRLGLYLHSRAAFAEAVPLFERALAIRERALGPDHPDVGESLNNLAELYRALGRYDLAAPLIQRALVIAENTVGSDHRDVGPYLNVLAMLYDAQGRFSEAEPLLQRALTVSEGALQPDHPEIGLRLNNLASNYHSQGDHARAEPLYKRALAIREQVLGPDHLEVGISLNNLAELHRDCGRYGEAEPLNKRALAISEAALGPDDPRVGTILNNLAGLYRALGRDEEAEPLHRRALTIAEMALGPDHPDLGLCLNNLAGLYLDLGRYDEAEPLCKRALSILEKNVGPDHPMARICRTNYEILKAEITAKGGGM